jgi:hypothetical protein
MVVTRQRPSTAAASSSLLWRTKLRQMNTVVPPQVYGQFRPSFRAEAGAGGGSSSGRAGTVLVREIGAWRRSPRLAESAARRLTPPPTTSGRWALTSSEAEAGHAVVPVRLNSATYCRVPGVERQA